MHVPVEHRAKIIATIDEAPHEHNNWDIVRSRKDLTTVRCRECQYQVKLKVMKRCEAFTTKSRCAKGAGCGDMHVHQQKMSLEDRVKKYGNGVLEKVPPSLRKGLDNHDGPPALLDGDDEMDGVLSLSSSMSSAPPGPPTPTAQVAISPFPAQQPFIVYDPLQAKYVAVQCVQTSFGVVGVRQLGCV